MVDVVRYPITKNNIKRREIQSEAARKWRLYDQRRMTKNTAASGNRKKPGDRIMQGTGARRRYDKIKDGNSR